MRKTLFALLFLWVSPALAQPVSLKAELVVGALDSPVLAISPSGDPRLFIVEQTGRIRVFEDGKLNPDPFLDLSSGISAGGEQGLLGLAFHPDYAANGRFFVNYTDPDGNTRIAGYTVSADPDRADPASGVELLSIEQPYANHNGGWLGFGPDGMLYVGTGDGGAGGDPQNRAQSRGSLLGKLLRIDVNARQPYAIPSGNPYAAGGGAPEIYMIGLRNPWRIAFDGDLIYVADVGQNRFEEISVLPIADAGANLGWRLMEGAAGFEPETDCETRGLVAPVYTYSHDEGCSITGGAVYRGHVIPELAGQYFFADFCTGFVRSLSYPAGTVTDWSAAIGNLGNITSFGSDGAGELYIATADGNLYRIAPTR